MFEKMKLKKAINQSKERIAEIEQKRTRSQAALVEAILRHTEPDDRDVDFFNQFTAQIEEERANLHRLVQQLEELEGKK
ncbi:MAG: hypothetical protein IJQ37_01550 [Clostridia bacterium]|nr:hypothetical protein [Clostridia bacterium]